MKQIKTLLLALTVCAFAFSSCSKKSNPTPTVKPSISLKFNGTSYTSASPVAGYSKSLNAIQIVGNFGTTANITLAIPSNFKVGSFDVATGAAIPVFSVGADVNSQDQFWGASGTVTITSFTSTTVAGTFNFVGTDSSNVNGTITTGQFEANYTNQ